VTVLKNHFLVTIEALIICGANHREIARRTSVDRKTIRRYAARSNSPGETTDSDPDSGQHPPPRPAALDETTPLDSGLEESRKFWGAAEGTASKTPASESMLPCSAAQYRPAHQCGSQDDPPVRGPFKFPRGDHRLGS
jgi:hypothetical protein